MFPHDADAPNDGLARRDLFDTDFDGFSRADFSRYHDYPDQLHQHGTKGHVRGPSNCVRDGVGFAYDDFMALSNVRSELGPRLDMIHRTMNHVFQGRTVASLDSFSSDYDFVPIACLDDCRIVNLLVWVWESQSV